MGLRGVAWHAVVSTEMSQQAAGDPGGVGLTYVDGLARSGTSEAIPVRFLIDSGANYSLLPHDVWTRLGLAPKRTLKFELADGTIIRRAISECHVELPYGDGHTPVLLGEPGDVALLGVITLEQFGFVFDPFTRSLKPMRLMLARLSA